MKLYADCLDTDGKHGNGAGPVSNDLRDAAEQNMTAAEKCMPTEVIRLLIISY